jgi:hypothetical protein
MKKFVTSLSASLACVLALTGAASAQPLTLPSTLGMKPATMPALRPATTQGWHAGPALTRPVSPGKSAAANGWMVAVSGDDRGRTYQRWFYYDAGRSAVWNRAARKWVRGTLSATGAGRYDFKLADFSTVVLHLQVAR